MQQRNSVTPTPSDAWLRISIHPTRQFPGKEEKKKSERESNESPSSLTDIAMIGDVL